MKLIFLVFIFLTSCTGVTVYKVGDADDVGLLNDLSDCVFLVRTIEENGDDRSDQIKRKITSYLKSLGYNCYPDINESNRGYLVVFVYNENSDTKQSIKPVYESGTEVTTSGTGYSYSSGYFSYNSKSTTPGKINYVPYSYIVHKASLSITVFDLANENKEDSLVWKAGAFFSGDEAKNFDEAVNYLIPAIFDRFGQPIKNLAETYEFNGDERQVKFLEKFNRSAKIVQRKTKSQDL